MDKLHAVRVPGRRRGRRDAQRRARRDGRQARPLPRPGRRGPADPGRAGRRTGDGRALRPRVAERPGRRRLRRVRPRRGPLHAAARAGGRADRRADSPAYLPGFFQIALGSVIDSPRITEAARSGEGVGWHEHDHDVHEGCERFFRPGYNANLVPSWLPALDGVVEKLERGGDGRRRRLRPRRLDDPDGQGVPELEVRRLRLPRRLDRDRARAGRGRRRRATGCSFEVAPAAGYTGNGYDLGDDVRLPARHGRPGRRGAPRRQSLGARRHLDDRRAEGRRPRRGEPQPGRPGLLRLLDAAVHAGVAVAGGRARARRPGGRGADPRRRHRRRLHALPPRAETPFNMVFEARP